jgi:carboxyl-terminal processing protease
MDLRPSLIRHSLLWALFLFVWLPSAASAQGPGRHSRNHAPSNQTSNGALSEKARAEVFEKVWSTVNEKYFDAQFNGVDWAAVHERYRPLVNGVATDDEFYALLSRMLGELRDPHTRFLTPKAVQANKRHQTTSTSVRLREVEGQLVIFAVEPGSEAARAGIEPGMIVRTVDAKPAAEALAQARAEVGDTSTTALTRLRVFARLLAGAPDTSVKLGLERADGSAFDAAITRRVVSSLTPLVASLLPSGYAYLKFDSFRDGSAKEVKAALVKFKDAPGLIVDLRTNGGGDVLEMRKIAGYFFAQKVFFGRGVNRTGKPLSYLGGLVKVPLEVYVGEGGGQLYPNPVVVLMSERTGSAAESFTEGLSENHRATVIGTASCGCVNIVLDHVGVKGGGELSVSGLGYLSPQGRKLEGVGVTPDLTVEVTLADLRARRDPSIEAADAYLKDQRKR